MLKNLNKKEKKTEREWEDNKKQTFRKKIQGRW